MEERHMRRRLGGRRHVSRIFLRGLLTLLLSSRIASDATEQKLSSDSKESRRESSGHDGVLDEFRCQWIAGEPASRQRVARLPAHKVDEDVVNEFLDEMRPLLVTGIIKEWPAYQTWTPELFMESFANYGKILDWTDAYEPITAANYKSKMADNSRFYLSWIADSLLPERLEIEMRENITSPPFLPPPPSGSPLVQWMYAGQAGTGAHVHHDHVCQATWAALLKGRKQWCLTSYLHEKNVRQSFAFVQEEGDLLLFSPVMWHSTHILEDAFSIHGDFSLHGDFQTAKSGSKLTTSLCKGARSDTLFQVQYEHCLQQEWDCPEVLSDSLWKRILHWPTCGALYEQLIISYSLTTVNRLCYSIILVLACIVVRTTSRKWNIVNPKT